MKVVWRVQRVTLDLASVRYRALLPCVALLGEGVTCKVTDQPGQNCLDSASRLVLVKSFTHADIELVKEARRRRIPVLFDLCDNIFVAGYGIGSKPTPAEMLREIAPALSAIIVPTESLGQIVERHLGPLVPVTVIQDGLEDQRVFAQERRFVARCRGDSSWRIGIGELRAKWLALKQILRIAQDPLFDVPAATKVILWFGNHGSPWSGFGLADILIFREALERLAEEQQVHLVVVSNNRERYEQDVQPLRVPSLYLDWSPEVLHQVLARADVMIAPNGLDSFSLCKSSNRTVMALAAGVPVVATPTPALERLRDCVWLGDPLAGLRAYLSGSQLAERHLAVSRNVLSQSFATPVIARLWKDALIGRSL
jgi:glycosyltransferase involved in cell wall biosynthesis